jgi:hypothetical protein
MTTSMTMLWPCCGSPMPPTSVCLIITHPSIHPSITDVATERVHLDYRVLTAAARPGRSGHIPNYQACYARNWVRSRSTRPALFSMRQWFVKSSSLPLKLCTGSAGVLPLARSSSLFCGVMRWSGSRRRMTPSMSDMLTE